jgi:hypothetical protein
VILHNRSCPTYVSSTSVDIIAPRAQCYNGVCSDQQRPGFSTLNWSKPYPPYLQPKSSLLSIQALATCPRPESVGSLVLVCPVSLNFHFNRAFSFPFGSPKYGGSSFWRVRLKFHIHSSLPFMLRAPPNLFPAVGCPNNISLT